MFKRVSMKKSHKMPLNVNQHPIDGMDVFALWFASRIFLFYMKLYELEPSGLLGPVQSCVTFTFNAKPNRNSSHRNSLV